jgi:very-short-patch-repair endonuclease
MTKEDFLLRARESHGYKYNYPNLNDKILSNDDIDIEYNGIIYRQKVVKHILLGRCPEKNTPSKTTEQFISEAKLIWFDKYDYSLVEYKGALKKVKIIYKGIVFEQVAVSHLNGQCCEKNLNQENFILKSKEKHGNRYDYSLVKFKNGNLPVLIGYKGIYYLQKPYYHLSGNRPENIKLAVRKTNKQFINESNQVHDFKYNYDKSDYISNQIKVIITCPIHGDFLQRPLSHIQGNGCSNCNESKGEKEIARFLNKNNILYYRQHKFHDCLNIFELPFDFYIPSKRNIIEFDGKQHYEPIEHFGGLKAYESLKVNDKIKNNYCEDNYIDLIRIRYDQIDRIFDILKESLKNKIILS